MMGTPADAVNSVGTGAVGGEAVAAAATAADPDAPIDCFYVYPTVSLDPTPNVDLMAGPEELADVEIPVHDAWCARRNPVLPVVDRVRVAL